ncbi:hypothetical protein E1B28_006757 [Marasmius oreades]|uniref:Uncharacterized protein n=1 Tax=Marasmius oreades TaxID=181124 RepID=A0A9P7UWR4_9AGAR|nr:uncharacterized protein E1B28_006757 [Marasmius oreades]KAG7096076.1 hypothetical protein E1B28_006757 [Marasmius oreades]
MLQEILRKLDDMSEHGVDELKHVVDKLLEDSETQNTFIQSDYLESSRVSRRPRIKLTFATPSPSSPPEPWKYNTLRLLPSSPIRHVPQWSKNREDYKIFRDQSIRTFS